MSYNTNEECLRSILSLQSTLLHELWRRASMFWLSLLGSTLKDGKGGRCCVRDVTCNKASA